MTNTLTPALERLGDELKRRRMYSDDDTVCLSIGDLRAIHTFAVARAEHGDRVEEIIAKVLLSQHDFAGDAIWEDLSDFDRDEFRSDAREILSILRLTAQEKRPEADLPNLFEAWWQTSPRRNRDEIGYSLKKVLAFEAFCAGRATSPQPTPHSQDVEREDVR